MNARIRPSARLTNKQKAAIREGVAEVLEQQKQGNNRRIFKLLCASLHEEYGFGKDRCMRIIDRISRVAAEHESDEVYWAHVDMLMEQIGLEFSKENYAEFE